MTSLASTARGTVNVW